MTDVGPAAMQIGAVLVLDTAGGFDPMEARHLIGERIRGVARLRQVLHETPPGCGRPVWIDDPSFDLSDHVVVDVGDDLGLEGALARAADLVATRLPRERPLWAVHFVPIDETRTGLVIVIHHSLTDGVGGLAVLASLVDGTTPAHTPWFPRPGPTTTALLLDALQERARAVARVGRLPRHLLDGVAELRSTGRARASRSSLNRPTGARRSLAAATIDLASIVDVAHACHGSVNDVVLAAVDGALVDLVTSRGERVDRFAVSVPVAARLETTASELGNQVGVAAVELPRIDDRLDRLREIAARGAKVRSAPRGASADLLGPVFRALARLGIFRWCIDRQHLVNSFVTNIRGPGHPLAFGGATITDVLPIATVSGNVTVSFAVMSYAGTLAITIIADPDTVPDLVVLTQSLQDELDAYANLGRDIRAA